MYVATDLWFSIWEQGLPWLKGVAGFEVVLLFARELWFSRFVMCICLKLKGVA